MAFEVCQVNVADWPLGIVSGLTEIEAVGPAGGGGGGGGGGAAFLWQAPSIRMALSKAAVATDLKS